MPVHSPLIKNVDLRRLGGSASGNDVSSDLFDGCQAAPGEKQLGPLAREGEGNSAAYGAAGSVDHRNFVLQHHLGFRSFAVRRRVGLRAVDDADTATPGK